MNGLGIRSGPAPAKPAAVSPVVYVRQSRRNAALAAYVELVRWSSFLELWHKPRVVYTQPFRTATGQQA